MAESQRCGESKMRLASVFTALGSARMPYVDRLPDRWRSKPS
ncbi:hypothetical protein [Limnospira platensis]